MGRADSCSKRTNPSPNHLAQAKAVERQPPATRYQRTRDHQDLRGRDPNHRTKKLLRWAVSWDQRIASGEVDRNPVEGSPVGNKVNPVVVSTLVGRGRTVRIVHKRFAGVGRVPAAAGKESLVVVGTVLLAAEETVVVRMIHLAAEGMVALVVVDTVAAGIRIEDPHTQIHPGAAETA